MRREDGVEGGKTTDQKAEVNGRIIGSASLSLGFSVATYSLRHCERIGGLKIETLSLQQ